MLRISSLAKAIKAIPVAAAPAASFASRVSAKSTAAKLFPRVTAKNAVSVLLAPKPKQDDIKRVVSDVLTPVVARSAKTATKNATEVSARRSRKATTEAIAKRDAEYKRAADAVRKRQGTTVLTQRVLIKDALTNGKRRSTNWYGLFLKSIAPEAAKAGEKIMTYASRVKATLTEAEINAFKAKAAAEQSKFTAKTDKIPKRPMSSYAAFFKETYPSVTVPEGLTNAQRIGAVAREIAARWSGLSASEKATYAPTEAALASYHKKMEALKRSME
jgi:hypothetical protein